MFASRKERKEQFIKLMPIENKEGVAHWLDIQNFFTAPASIKYHGNYEGGLFDHSYTVMCQLIKLTKDNCLYWQRPESPHIVGMFHDLCKMDIYKWVEPHLIKGADEKFIQGEGHWERNDDTLLKGHGDKSVMLLSSLMKLTEEEILCIRYHMGAFTEKEQWNDYTRAIHKYSNVLWTHQADMLASHVIGV